MYQAFWLIKIAFLVAALTSFSTIHAAGSAQHQLTAQVDHFLVGFSSDSDDKKATLPTEAIFFLLTITVFTFVLPKLVVPTLTIIRPFARAPPKTTRT